MKINIYELRKGFKRTTQLRCDFVSIYTGYIYEGKFRKYVFKFDMLYVNGEIKLYIMDKENGILGSIDIKGNRKELLHSMGYNFDGSAKKNLNMIKELIYFEVGI